MRAQFTSQKQRFTPELEDLLLAAFALQPSDGRFVDFDPFSNTQVHSPSILPRALMVHDRSRGHSIAALRALNSTERSSIGQCHRRAASWLQR